LEDSNGIAYRSIDLNRDGLAAYGDKSFDIVLCSDVIEHLESPAMLLREIGRVLRPDGLAIVSFPNSWNILERIRFLFSANFRRFRSERKSGPWGHISFFTTEILESLCDRAGLDIKALRGGSFSGHIALGGYYMKIPASLLLSYNVYAVLQRSSNQPSTA
jgi:2-polyprenyl-6-hydroxyphenyl methylase/3-demethylubiquinone-9 3-methyltransferase